MEYPGLHGFAARLFLTPRLNRDLSSAARVIRVDYFQTNDGLLLQNLPSEVGE